jgi:hypothetical protein
MGQVIFGVDFKSKSQPVQHLIDQEAEAFVLLHGRLWDQREPDTTPSDYVAPDGDCA